MLPPFSAGWDSEFPSFWWT